MSGDEDAQEPIERCGLAWTHRETSILYQILQKGGNVSEAFPQIGRGEDAIKRKWRKILADKRNKRKHFAPSRKEDHDSGQIRTKNEARNGTESEPKGDSPSPEPMSEASSYAPSVDYTRPSSSVPGAACDDCRQKHKRCSHRVGMKGKGKKVKSRKSGASVNSQGKNWVAEDSEDSSSSDTGKHIETSSSKKQCASTMRKVGNTVARQQSMPWSSASKVKNDPVLSRRLPKPINLTANGKRRGRPPKSVVAARLEAQKNAADDNFDFGGTRRQAKQVRQTAEDCEKSTSSKSIVLGGKRISHIKDTKTPTRALTRQVLSERSVNTPNQPRYYDPGSPAARTSSKTAYALLSCSETAKVEAATAEHDIRSDELEERLSISTSSSSGSDDVRDAARIIVDLFSDVSSSMVRNPQALVDESVPRFTKVAHIGIKGPVMENHPTSPQTDTFLIPDLHGVPTPYRPQVERPYSAVREEALEGSNRMR